MSWRKHGQDRLCWLMRGSQSSRLWEDVPSGSWPQSLWLSKVVYEADFPHVCELTNRVKTSLTSVGNSADSRRHTVSAVGTPVTRRPPHSPGRAGFPQPVPRLDSRPRKAGVQAYTLRCRSSVIRGRSWWTASRIWVKRAQLKLLRFPPRRLSHLNAHFVAHSKKRESAWEFPWTP